MASTSKRVEFHDKHFGTSWVLLGGIENMTSITFKEEYYFPIDIW